jgi:DNA repair ATPase RecN
MVTLTSLQGTLALARSRYDSGRGQRDLLMAQKADKEMLHSNVLTNLTRWQLTKALLTEVTEFARKQLVERIEATVTAGLRIILGRDDLSFKVAFRKVSEVSWADWQVVSIYNDATTTNGNVAGVEVANNPEDSRGGGIVDIVSLTLRLALLELSIPRPEGPVILDEIAKMISVQYSHNLAMFLKSYALRTNRQITLVTHNVTLALSGDLIYWVSQENGISQVREIQPDELRELWKDVEDKARVSEEAVS